MWTRSWALLGLALTTISCINSNGAGVLPRSDGAVDLGAADAGVPVVDNRLVFTGDDGKVIQFSPQNRLRVWCGPWDGEVAPVPSVHVVFTGPAEEDPAWMIQAVLADVRPGVALTFPNSFHFQSPRGASVFAHDGKNEASTAEEGAGGRLTFETLSCEEGSAIAFTLDAILGSELHDRGPITAKGTFRGVIGPPPSPDSD